ncbi:hypothetical protein ACIRPH_30920 [Nocardiopsis sp. NPDC101807]|uniref:hypothetical protein n=1 Tax=Nocardiopsis sp. NPDC101807 TaxID=3364339 RepID=UPI003825D2FF
MSHEDQISQQMDRLTIAAQNTITHWSDLEVRGHLKEHPDFVEHSLTLIEDMTRTVRAAIQKERPDCGNVASGEPARDFDDQVNTYRGHSCTCDYCYQQEPDPDLDPDYLYEAFSTPAAEQEVRLDYPGCSRDDLIRLLGTAKNEATETTNTIIAAAEAAASSGPDAAVAIIAQYVLDNGHVLDPAGVTTGRMYTLAAQDRTEHNGRFEEAFNLWENAWEECHDIYTGPPTTNDNNKAATAIREALAKGHEQEYILQAAHHAGAMFRTDIDYFLPRQDAR